MPIPFYRCEKCRREHDTLEGAEKCEAAHLTVISARVKGYGIYPYPYEVEVVFSNGETRVYLADNMI